MELVLGLVVDNMTADKALAGGSYMVAEGLPVEALTGGHIVGLDTAGLDTAGSDTAGLGTAESDSAGLDTAESESAEWDSVRLDTVEPAGEECMAADLVEGMDNLGLVADEVPTVQP